MNLFLTHPPAVTLASGVDIPSWGGLVISALVAGGAFLLWLIKVQSRAANDETGDAKLVKALEQQINDQKDRIKALEDDLDDEKRGREDDNRRHRNEIDDLRRELTNEINTLRGQLLDAYRNRQPLYPKSEPENP